MGKGLSREQRAIVDFLEVLTEDDPLVFDGWRQQYQIQRKLWPPEDRGAAVIARAVCGSQVTSCPNRISCYRSLARLVERNLVKTEVIDPFDYGGIFQRYPYTRFPPSKQRTRPIRLYAAIGAPDLSSELTERHRSHRDKTWAFITGAVVVR
jgi:hypothetical protein